MYITSRLAMTLAAGTLLVFSAPALAQGMSGHNMADHNMSQQADAQAYKFELVGTPKPLNAKQHIVTVRLLQAMHGMSDMAVSGAVITKVQLDMSPDNMPTMTAPAAQVPSSTPGVYSFAFDNSVWADKGHWALVLTAKVKGEVQPINGRVVFQTGL